MFDGLEVARYQNDGEALAAALGAAADVMAVLQRLRGPWALMWWHQPTLTLWFGRDVIGMHLPPT